MPRWRPAFSKRVSLLSAYARELPHVGSKNALLGNICQRYGISGSPGAIRGLRSSSGPLVPLRSPSAPGYLGCGRGGSRILRPSLALPRSEYFSLSIIQRLTPSLGSTLSALRDPSYPNPTAQSPYNSTILTTMPNAFQIHEKLVIRLRILVVGLSSSDALPDGRC